ncbi:MAG TPA: acyl-CoA dehydrogenase [Novosphingobium sp.]
MIDLIPDEEQQALLDSFRDLLAAESPVTSGALADVWDEIVPLGWLGLLRPETLGGAGLGPVELVLLMRESGRFLATPTMLATIAAIALLDVDGQSDAAGALADGVDRAALAFPRVAGEVYLVDAERAEFALLVADGAASVHRIAGERKSLVSVDERVTLTAASLSAPLTGRSDALSVRLMVAAQLVGVAEAVRDMAIEQAKLRQQFGQAIGSFQAIKHACADLAIRAESAGAQTAYAALAVANRLAGAETEVAAAVRIAQRAALANAEASIQIHGAMGTTDECQAHLFLKRANMLSLLDGRANWQMEALLGA